ncbi:MAG: hypothetical protein P4M08_06780 [Oligoflexia bacterium]|nr:hypothetical protein [Oligoflexia bacterium]
MKARWLLALTASVFAAASAHADSITTTYPDLEKFTYSEKASKIYFGFGLSPIAVVGNKLGLSIDLFQVHYIKGAYDFEILSATFGSAFGSSVGSEQFFLLRTVPKFRILKNVSIGPLIGVEFVSYANVTEQLNKYVTLNNDLFAQPFTFTSTGLIYGGAISETLELGKSNLIKINEFVYQETYSYLGTNNGWTYYFNNQPSLNTDPSPIKPSTVFMLNISLLY